MVYRHFAWFHATEGHWLGEWAGYVPAPALHLHNLIGEARLRYLNEWTHQIQRWITPSGSPYRCEGQAWDLDRWDDCADGAAGTFDVTMYRWPLGDFYFAVFDGIDRLLDFREMRTYLQIDRAQLAIDASLHSPRIARSHARKLIADVTATPLDAWADRLQGQFVKRDGRIVFEPRRRDQLPEAIAQAVTDPALLSLGAFDPALLQEQRAAAR